MCGNRCQWLARLSLSLIVLLAGGGGLACNQLPDSSESAPPERSVLLERTLPPIADDLAVAGPSVPLAAVAISPYLLAAARQQMAAGAEERACGPYRLLTDVGWQQLRALCSKEVAAVDGAYAVRYGRRPLGAPAETLLIFASAKALAVFTGATSRWRVESTGRASAAHGYVALSWVDREATARAATLVHELTHLVNRRALGPGLPPWLDEGLADDLANELVGGKFQPAAWQVGMDRAAGKLLPLRELVALDNVGFYGGRGYANYAQAYLFLRFLVGDPEFGARFTAFLDALAGGESVSPELLAGYLGRLWPAVETSWGSWLASGSSSRHTASPSR